MCVAQISFQEFKNKLLEKGMVAKIQVTNRSTAKVFVYADGIARPLVKENAATVSAPANPEDEFLAFSDEPAAEVTGSRDKGGEGQRRVTGPGGILGSRPVYRWGPCCLAGTLFLLPSLSVWLLCCWVPQACWHVEQ